MRARGLLQRLLGLLLLTGIAFGEGRYVFLVDTSASMIGREDGWAVVFPKIQRELIRFAEQVTQETEVHIIAFAQEPQEAAHFLLPHQREAMLRHIRNLSAEGNASHIYHSLNQVYNALCDQPRAFFLFTDGLDNSSQASQMPLLQPHCPLTLIALGSLPTNFHAAWKGQVQNRLVVPTVLHSNLGTEALTEGSTPPEALVIQPTREAPTPPQTRPNPPQPRPSVGSHHATLPPPTQASLPEPAEHTPLQPEALPPSPSSLLAQPPSSPSPLNGSKPSANSRDTVSLSPAPSAPLLSPKPTNPAAVLPSPAQTNPSPAEEPAKPPTPVNPPHAVDLQEDPGPKTPLELPTVWQPETSPLEVPPSQPRLWWSLPGLLGLLLLGLGLARKHQASSIPRGANPDLPMPLSLDFSGAAPERRRKYLPLLVNECDLGEATKDANLERLWVRLTPKGLEVLHIPGHLRLWLGETPLAPGQIVTPGQSLYLREVDTGAFLGLLSVQRM